LRLRDFRGRTSNIASDYLDESGVARAGAIAPRISAGNPTGINWPKIPKRRPPEIGAYALPKNYGWTRARRRQHDDPADQVGQHLQERVRFADPVQRMRPSPSSFES
jgi:hypothetical protein